jgi:hydrogenase nickel incorporation protein HypA/HybF
MHELSIAMSLVELAEEEADSRGVWISAIHLKLGVLSGVVKEALLSSFEMASENTALQGSRLVIEEVPVVVFCPNCKEQQPLNSIQLFSCPECNAPCSEILQGREIKVVALEIQECVPNPV